jgi:flagellin
MMQINHNIRAMITQHALYSNNSAMSKSLEKLSTGLRINRAQDDSAGLAMSEQMRTQIRGLGKAKQNSQDGIAALQIAEAGLAEITNIMQRQRELAIQSSNDTLTSTERKYLDDEFQELSKEIGRIALGTDYNGKNMLSNGTYKAESGVELDIQKGQIDYGDVANFVGGTQFTADNSFGVVNPDSTSDEYNTAKSYTLHVGANFSTNVGGQMANQMAVTYSGVKFNGTGNLYDFSIGNFGATSQFAVDGNRAVNFATLEITGRGVSTNTMANAFGGNPAGGTPDNVGTRAIYRVIDALDGAVKSISGARAKIGTYINRLEYTINNIASMEYNTQDAESRIRDTDFAKETTDFTRNQILVQSATSILAQANSLPSSVLGLIG